MDIQLIEVPEAPRIINAFLDDERMLLIKLSQPFTVSDGPDNALLMDVTTSQSIAVLSIESAASTTSSQADLLRITLAEIPDVTHTLQIGLTGFLACSVVARNVLNLPLYYYAGDDLGNVYTPQSTSFRLWAPTASDVQVLLYRSEDGPLTQLIGLQRVEAGTWYGRVEMDLAGWYYLYLVTAQGKAQTVVDPYVKGLAVNAERGMIIDSEQIAPPGWKEDRPVELANAVDAVIYEMHVRDFSIADNSGMLNKGKYLALTEYGTTGPSQVATGIDSLKLLGITHVQVMPVADFGSIDERDPEQYNWGYDPRCYNVPEGAYATTPHGTVRVVEYKCMVQSLHHAGLGVIMDVVYNHTFALHDSDFNKIVPLYYYRTDDAGNYTNGSGIGNEIATERPMVLKFMLDSLKYWARAYHVDGFRFDLMALLGVDALRQVVGELRAINPSMLLYGEPWTGGTSALPAEQLVTKGQQKNLGLGVFNDTIRNCLVGSVFDARARGFVTGELGLVEILKKAVRGSIDDFAATPGESINYVTSHDNLTLWDRISSSSPEASEQERIQMDKLAQAVVMTSQGVAFIQGGEEFLRTKNGNDNSYNAGDAINQFDWTRKAQYLDVFNYYASLIHLRLAHPAFRMTTEQAINQALTFLPGPDNTLAFLLKDYANGDSWRNIIVIYNPRRESINYSLPDGGWAIAVGGPESDLVSGSVAVGPISCMVLYQI